jgi:hypothetical protein
MDNTLYILYIKYEKNENIEFFCKNIEVILEKYNDFEINDCIYMKIFNINDYDKYNNMKLLLEEYIEILTEDIINHNEIHKIININYIIDYLQKQIYVYEKNINKN